MVAGCEKRFLGWTKYLAASYHQPTIPEEQIAIPLVRAILAADLRSQGTPCCPHHAQITRAETTALSRHPKDSTSPCSDPQSPPQNPNNSGEVKRGYFDNWLELVIVAKKKVEFGRLRIYDYGLQF